MPIAQIKKFKLDSRKKKFYYNSRHSQFDLVFRLVLQAQDLQRAVFTNTSQTP